MPEPIVRACKWCAADLSSRRIGTQFCNQGCGDRYRNRQRHPVTERVCGHCGTDMAGKRPHAVYCSRTCKSMAAEIRLRPVGTPVSRKRNAERYERERKRRIEYARAQYEATREQQIVYAREWRKANPDKRRVQHENRRALKRGNPGYVPVAGSDWTRLKRRFNDRCAYCASSSELHMDHVVPLSRGGRHAPANILPACSPCNLAKSALLLIEWKALLRKRGGDAPSLLLIAA